MKEIIMYVCDDGSKFTSKKEAQKRDELIEKVNNVLALLKSREEIEKQISFSESEIAIRQDKDTVFYAMSKLMDICLSTIGGCYPHEVFTKYKDAYRLQDGSVHISHLYRIISDFGMDILRNALYRFECIDTKTGIEYPYPMYVKNPELFIGKII